jgi:hypothetical protein
MKDFTRSQNLAQKKKPKIDDGLITLELDRAPKLDRKTGFKPIGAQRDFRPIDVCGMESGAASVHSGTHSDPTGDQPTTTQTARGLVEGHHLANVANPSEGTSAQHSGPLQVASAKPIPFSINIGAKGASSRPIKLSFGSKVARTSQTGLTAASKPKARLWSDHDYEDETNDEASHEAMKRIRQPGRK